MNYWEALIYGVVQGLTEFLPISSTAHVVIVSYFLGEPIPGLGLEIFLHQASLLAVLVYYRGDLWKLICGFIAFVLHRRAEDKSSFLLGLYIAVATVLTAAIGLLLLRLIGDSLKSPYWVAGALALSGCALIYIERFSSYGDRTEARMRPRDGVLVGLAQALAVLPGISRSGSTLVAGLLCGLQRETAVRFSFLLAIPVILGSPILAFSDLESGMFRQLGTGPLAVAGIVCFVTSLAGILWLINFLKRGRLSWFAFYLFALALFVAVYFPSRITFISG